METISLELSKRLAPYLEDVETEFFYYNDVEYDINNYVLLDTKEELFKKFLQWHDFKTLTLEEAIEFLQTNIAWIYDIVSAESTQWNYFECNYYKDWPNKDKPFDVVSWKTLLEAIEKMLEYLLDNDLL